jgi:hypothetical protein
VHEVDPGGSQSPFWQVQPGPGWTVGQPDGAATLPPLLVLPPLLDELPLGTRFGGTQLPFTQTQSEAG